MTHYKDASVLTKFPQITTTTDIVSILFEMASSNKFQVFPCFSMNNVQILSDFAATIGKGMKELIAENNKVWDSIDMISEKLTKEQAHSCEQRMTKNGIFYYTITISENILR